jgi:hypothetical protein
MARHATAQEIQDTDDRPVDVHAAEVPPGVRQAALALMQPGDQLWRCLRMSAPRGLLGLGARYPVVEWWLVDAKGDLIEAFWEED